MTKLSKIPTPLLKMLKTTWKPYDLRSDYFTILKRQEFGDRWARPAFYGFKPSGEVDDALGNEMRRKEAIALAPVPQFSGLINRDGNDVVTVNEHARHAVSAFCSQTYDVWRMLEARLAEIPRTR